MRDAARIILSNPDMLHAGILPQHPRWAAFFANLRVVVIDEMHVYRGVFGSHVANVLRRLRRICPVLRERSAVHPGVGHDRQPRRAGRAAGRGAGDGHRSRTRWRAAESRNTCCSTTRR